MPGFDVDAVMNLLRSPNFPRTGNHVADIRAAHNLAQHQSAYMRELGTLAKGYIEHLGPELGGEVERVIQSAEFKKMVANSPNDGLANLHIAHGIAQQWLNARGANKAKRAAPVRSRSTHSSKTAAGDPLDRGDLERARRLSIVDGLHYPRHPTTARHHLRHLHLIVGKCAEAAPWITGIGIDTGKL